MALDRYREKRDFHKTPEPQGRASTAEGDRFVVQEHRARRHHFDFRLEMGGVLKSWAVPKGPSFDPEEKRLAVHVEDHPLDYAEFEGVIPAGEYGAGSVIVWDHGRWYPEGDPEKDYRRGRLHFRLEGVRLRGGWTLARMGGAGGEEDNWLLIKRRDGYAGLEDPTGVHRSVLSGRTLDEVEAAPERFWSAEMAGPATDMPDWLPPQLAHAVDRPPQGDRWLHEIKLDGYRMACRVNNGTVTLLSRNRKDWTRRFGHLVRAVAGLPLRHAWFDGEVVVVRPDGRTDFQALQNAIEGRRSADVVYFLFDLLYLDGNDLRPLPLRERKTRLSELLARGHGASSPLRYSDHLQGRGEAFFEQACGVGLEGIVSKDGDRPYLGGRTRDWLKVKCLKRQEFVIGGFTDPGGGRRGIGALLLGVYDEGGLRYAGKVGTGFDHDTLLELRRRLEPFEVDGPPFLGNLPGQRHGIHWVRPALVAEVAFSEWTREGVVRQASYQGLREDKSPEEVGIERTERLGDTAEGGGASQRRSGGERLSGIRLSNPDKVLFPDQGLSKRDLAAYYDAVAERVLADVGDRPLTLLRCPNGRHRDCFYQKHADDSVPAAVGRVMVPEKGREQPYLYIADPAGLIGLVQMGVLEIHPWGARRDRLESPDRMIFDLDPDTAVPWEAVLAAAVRLREILEQLGLVPFLRTTGGKGLHLVVPLMRRHDWSEVKETSRAIARRLVQQDPRIYTLHLSKSKRGGKIYIDYLRNAMGATAVGNYTTRARPGAPVATPLGWDELVDLPGPAAFHVGNVPERVHSLPDPWRGFAGLRQSITKGMQTELGM